MLCKPFSEKSLIRSYSRQLRLTEAAMKSHAKYLDMEREKSPSTLKLKIVGANNMEKAWVYKKQNTGMRSFSTFNYQFSKLDR